MNARRTRRNSPLRRFAAIAIVAMLVAVVAACGDSASGSDSDTATDSKLPVIPASKYADLTGRAEVEVEAKDNVFVPRYIKVSKGTKVTFVNVGDVPHNALPAEEGAFSPVNTDDFGPGDRKSVTFAEVGEFPYYCSLHGTARQGMNGRIIVT